MVRKTTQTTQPIPASLSLEQMRRAIPRLQRRIKELDAIDLSSLTNDNGDDTLQAQVNKIDMDLLDIFGANTIEYNRHKVEGLSAFPMVFTGDTDLSFHGRLLGVRASVASALSNLRSIVDIFTERVEGDKGDELGRVIRAYEGLELHPEIARAASALYIGTNIMRMQ
jgi:hypothetical protein